MSIAKSPGSGDASNKKYNPKADPATWPRCLEFMTKKKRFCNLPRLPGINKCGVHHEGGQARMPCPVDPSHTVFAHQLAAHVKVCNATKISRVLEAKPYFSKGVNSGTVGAAATASVANGQIMARRDVEKSSETTMDSSAEFTTCQTSVATLDDISLLAKIEALYAQHCGGAGDGSLVHCARSSTKEVGSSNPASSNLNELEKSKSVGGNGEIALRFERAVELEMYLAASTSAEGALTRRAAHRHLLQQTSIISSLKRVGLLDPSACFVELGAGRGMLGLAVIAALNKNKPTSAASNQGKLVLVERYPVRNKADRDLRKLQETADAREEDDDADGSNEEKSSPNKRLRTDQSSNDIDGGSLESGAAVTATALAPSAPAAVTVAATPSTATVAASLPAIDGFSRARVDIRDLNMAGLPHAQSRVVAVAKHLCGVATDLGLRALLTCKNGVNGHTATGQEGTVQGGAPTVTEATASAAAPASTANDDNPDGCNDDWPGRGWVNNRRGRNGGKGLRSTSTALSSHATDTTASAAEVLGLQGVCIATCCHHCVKWDDYVARGFFQEELGLGPADFVRMRKWSGWATNPVGAAASSSASSSSSSSLSSTNATSSASAKSSAPSEDAAHTEGTGMNAVAESTASAASGGTTASATTASIHEGDHASQVGAVGALAVKNDPVRRRALGRACKRLIDLGRLHFLRSLGLEAELLHYCPPEVTQENALLLAWNPRTTAAVDTKKSA